MVTLNLLGSHEESKDICISWHLDKKFQKHYRIYYNYLKLLRSNATNCTLLPDRMKVMCEFGLNLNMYPTL